MNVWLAEKAGSPVDREVHGIFSSPDRARMVCQDVANEYFGKRNTPALSWLRREAEDWLKVSVQCDDVEDGIAAVWKAFADRSSVAGSKAEDKSI